MADTKSKRFIYRPGDHIDCRVYAGSFIDVGWRCRPSNSMTFRQDDSPEFIARRSAVMAAEMFLGNATNETDPPRDTFDSCIAVSGVYDQVVCRRVVGQLQFVLHTDELAS